MELREVCNVLREIHKALGVFSLPPDTALDKLIKEVV
jgi:hypothetical protein